MPVIRVDMLHGRSIEQKRALADALTKVTCDVLGATPAAVTVCLTEYGGEDWAVGGQLVADRG